MFLSITARPDISLSPGPIYAESGADAVLRKCHVIGYPPPVVSWTKLFDELPGKKGTVKDHTLTITKADRKDAGTYICTATNHMGSSHAMTTLIVNVVPQFTVTLLLSHQRRYRTLSWTVSYTELLGRWITSTNYHLVKMQRKNCRGTYTYEGRSDKD